MPKVHLNAGKEDIQVSPWAPPQTEVVPDCLVLNVFDCVLTAGLDVVVGQRFIAWDKN
jgi:hypothetical protein